jgi:transcription antitermination protein NusB
MIESRRKSREVVLRALYEMDIGGHDPTVAMERLIEEHHLEGDVESFTRTLLSGILDNRRAIDAAIEGVATERPTEALSAVDRNILRIAVREFLVDNLTPVGAAINEAVELAKRYGSDSSAKFINGVLGALSTSDQAVIQEGK